MTRQTRSELEEIATRTQALSRSAHWQGLGFKFGLAGGGLGLGLGVVLSRGTELFNGLRRDHLSAFVRLPDNASVCCE